MIFYGYISEFRDGVPVIVLSEEDERKLNERAKNADVLIISASDNERKIVDDDPEAE
jgi:hypothetical protein